MMWEFDDMQIGWEFQETFLGFEEIGVKKEKLSRLSEVRIH